MTAEEATYLDSSAIVKLAVEELETGALRDYLRGRAPLVSSALAQTEVGRSMLRLGPDYAARGDAILRRLDLVRVSDRTLRLAARLPPPGLRSLDAIHLATAEQLGEDLGAVVTYDERMATAARHMGYEVVAPA